MNYRGSRNRGETTSGPKLTSVPTLSSLGRPGSPPPELLTCEGTRIAEFFKWHFGALTLPKSANGNLIMLAQELGNLPNKISVEGHTDTKAFANPATTATGNSPPAANCARRLMQSDGLGSNQVTQVRGFADHRLHKLSNPLDPSHRRISLIEQYIAKSDEERAPPHPSL